VIGKIFKLVIQLFALEVTSSFNVGLQTCESDWIWFMLCHMAKLAREPKFCGKIVRGSEKGRRARQPAMTVIARLAAAAAAGGRARRALTPVVSDFLMEVVNSGEWVVAGELEYLLPS
jgi:hypothetical protein